MELAHIPLNQLKISPQNMRHSKKEPDVSDIMPSIQKLGIQQPLLVRENGEGFEIVAGRRRYFSLMQIAKDAENMDDVPCAVMVAGDDAAALEASLIENVARLDPDMMSRYETFSKLVANGKTVEDIVETFGVTEIMVKRSLALGNLLPAIRKLFQSDDIDVQTIRLLTLANNKQQKEWLKLKRKDDEPQSWQLKQWLFGGELKLSHALFSIEEYDGQIVTDLFGEEGYFDNSDKFWELQNKSIAELSQKLTKSGWNDVIILEVGNRFDEWQHAEIVKKEGGNVYIEVGSTGEVIEHKGFIPRSEFNARNRNAEGDGDNAEPVVKPELTKAAQNYLELHRHAAVRATLLNEPDLALRLFVAHAICGSSQWSVKPEPQRADKKETAQSVFDSTAQKAFYNERTEVFKILNWPTDADIYTCTNNYTFDIFSVFKTLQSCSNQEVQRVLTFVMAETLSSGTALVEMLGNMLQVNMKDFWQPENLFLDLVRDKRALNAMLNDVGGKEVADANISSTAKIHKKIINDCLEGEGREKVTGWQPNYMSFPFKTYTKSGAGELSDKAHYAIEMMK